MRSIKWYQWLMVFGSAHVLWKWTLDYIRSYPDDINCIKKHHMYMTGKLNARILQTVSMKKAKAHSKRMGITFNELVLGVLSKTTKAYFKEQGDDSSMITIALPFCFNSVPKDCD